MKTRFEVEPRYADALRAAGLHDFDAMMRVTGGEPTSKHRHRETVPIEFDVGGQRQRFFLKRVFKVPGQHGWRPWLRGQPGYSQPAREWTVIEQMRAAGLPVMKRVAMGERRRFGVPTQAFIVVEAVPMQWTLENWLVPGFPKPPGTSELDAGSLWYAVGRLVGQMLACGFNWPDLHAKHIFAECANRNELDSWSLAMIDVERATRADNRATLFATPFEYLSYYHLFSSILPGSISERELDMFQSGFLANKSPAPNAEFARVMSSMALGDMPTLIDPADHLLSDEFIHPRAKSMTQVDGMYCDSNAWDLLAKIGIRETSAAFSLTNAQTLGKPGLERHRDRLRVEVNEASGRSVTFFLKRYRRPPIRSQLRRIWEADGKRSTAYREFKAINELNERGIPTMAVVAYGEEMCCNWERRSFIVSRAVKGESLESLAKRCLADPTTIPDRRERLEIIHKLAVIVRELHSCELYHRDLYLSHVFIGREPDERIVLYLIDLARVPLRRRARHFRWRFKDVAALAYSSPPRIVSRTDRLRFLRTYLLLDYDHVPSGAFEDSRRLRTMLRRFVRGVEARMQRMARHDRKRAARLGLATGPIAGPTTTLPDGAK